jgi:signal transduction histidine kinase
MDVRLKGYLKIYKEILDKEFLFEKEIQKLGNHFDDISKNLTGRISDLSNVSANILESEIETAEKLRTQLKQSFIISMTLGMCGVLILLFILERRIVHPIRAIAEIARDVRSGNTKARVVFKENQRDEVVRLGWDLNAMLDTLEQKNTQLVTYQNQLERKVQQLAHREEELQKHRYHLQEMVNEQTRELEAAQEALVRRERMALLGQLTAVVSHELRTPLGTIQTSLFSLRERLGGTGPEVSRVLDRAERNIARCDRIIEDLLDFTRIRVINPEPTQIDEWLAELLDEQILPKEISLTKDLAAGVNLPLDRDRFGRCMINVINNAKEAMMEQNGAKGLPRESTNGGHLTVATRVSNNRLEVRVIDTGPGLRPDELEKIFEPLYSTKTFGVGLGLPIVKQIVEQHSGRLEVEGRPGQGTVVTMRLPLVG